MEKELNRHIVRCQDFMEGIVDAVYGEDPLDLDDLENYIEELCARLEMPCPVGKKAIGIRSAKYRGYSSE